MSVPSVPVDTGSHGRTGSAVVEASTRCRFPQAGTPVTCAVSGGPDSTALLVLAVHSGLRVTAVHVDHGLRPGSEMEAEVVADVARRFGAAFRAERAVVAPGGDLEARARRARHAVLPADALFGHTADDQAETVLLALLRGSGLDGLRAMTAERHPLLGVRRHETEAVCREVGVDPVRDPSNDDPRFRRNRVRHEILPLLDLVAERDVAALLARTASLVGDDLAFLDDLASSIDPTDARELAAAPEVLARRAVRRWLRGLDAEDHPPDSDAVARVLAVARGEAVATHVAGGVEVRRSAQRLTARPLRGPARRGAEASSVD